ncbi:MAG: thiamine biosynthesis protein ThiS [Phycisphaeraceae bacterium]|nr:thiamine biosynthesis protein ThiS [Phycisphaeraceae bacterium]
MARVQFTANLKRHVDCPSVEAAGRTVREVMDEVLPPGAPARGYVLDEHGALRTHMTIFVDGEAVRDRVKLSDAVGEDSEIYVMQALSGG